MTRAAPPSKFRSRLDRILSPLRSGRLASTATPAAPETEALQTTHPISVPNEQRVQALQRSLGMRFQDPIVLREALTHRSYLNEINQAWPSNERLEFLGDAVLGLISTDYLFHRFPDLLEGELTNLRSALVRTETLARFAGEIDLGQYLFLGRGEEMSKGRQRAGGLACAFEALLAAIYIDQGYAVARDFAMRFLEPELAVVLEGRLHKNSKSLLQEFVQARMQQTPTYHLVDESGPDHAKSFTVEVRVGSKVLGTGHDRSKRGAEQVAAGAALRHLQAQDQRVLT
jgi:ribonuclease-3